MSLTRRSFLGGAAALLAAPAIVRASSLMPVYVIDDPANVFNALNPAAIRDLLCPGLQLITGVYHPLPEFWINHFREHPEDIAARLESLLAAA